jgi:hypothetical protein
MTSPTYPLSLMCCRSDRHEALFGCSVHPPGDLIEGFYKIPSRKVFLETFAPFVPLPVALTSGIGKQLVC